MAAILRDSVVVRTRPRAIPLAMITIRKILHGFPFLSHDDYGAPLGCPSGRRSSAIKGVCVLPYSIAVKSYKTFSKWDKKCVVIVQKSLSKKKHFEINKSQTCFCSLYVKLATVQTFELGLFKLCASSEKTYSRKQR